VNRNDERASTWYRRKADQHWEMAGLARADRDLKDAERRTKLAQEYEAKAREAYREEK
jgi:hypothetical protein